MHDYIDSLLSTGKQILFAGIGNVLRSDDGIGVYISKRIVDRDRVRSLTVETAIENYIGKINSLRPDILVLIDCAEMNADPGKIILTDLEKTADVTFNTHNISLLRLKDFFQMPVYLLSIQPENVDFGENISYLVKKSADNLLKHLNRKGGYHAS